MPNQKPTNQNSLLKRWMCTYPAVQFGGDGCLVYASWLQYFPLGHDWQSLSKDTCKLMENVPMGQGVG